MHTILRDGNRLHLGISTGGHYLSEDGGQTFMAANQGVGAGFAPDPYPEFGQCVHKIAGHPAAPGRLYMQNHGGWADWSGPGWAAARHRRPAQRRPRQDVEIHRQGAAIRFWLPDRGAPARRRHGLRHAARADDAHLPGRRSRGLAQRERRRLVEAARRGMAKKESYFTVLRDAMDIDDLRSPALYFGTTTGQLWIGHEGGEEWSCLFDSLPPIHCVKVAVV